jgi:hypothetical protein
MTAAVNLPNKLRMEGLELSAAKKKMMIWIKDVSIYQREIEIKP